MKTPAVTLGGLDHVVLRTADVDRLVRFYSDVLGCREERRVARIGLVQMRAGRHMIDLLDSGAAPPQEGAANMDHFCVRLVSFDEAAIRAHLAAHGIAAGPTVIRYGAEGDGPSIYIEDPDGNTVELKGPPTPAPPLAVAP